MSTEGREYPELLADIADKIGNRLVAGGVDPERAADLGFEAAELVRTEWGGRLQYMPKGTRYLLSLRDQEIFNKFGTKPVEELALEYDLSVMQIYRIFKSVRHMETNKRQGSLFEGQA